MKKIRPCLWFDNQAEEAVSFYTTVFENSKVLDMRRYTAESGPMPAGTVMTATFRIEDEEFMALNAGPRFKFNEAISMVVDCKDQKEVDYYWNRLSEDGETSMCGWLKDKFGLWWQVVPTVLDQLMNDPDEAKSQRVMEAMFQMTKIDIAQLEAAANGV